MPEPSPTTAVTRTFLFTDVEGSVRLWEQSPELMGGIIARHDDLIAQAVTRHGGHLFKTVGDSCCAAFASPVAAVAAAVEAQLALLREPWPDAVRLAVRMALHVGPVTVRGEDYFGPPVNRVARLLGTAHGGQILLSEAVAAATAASLPAGCALHSLGEHLLRDLQRPELVSQVCHPNLPTDFAPLRSLQSLRHNLPQLLNELVGRDEEVTELRRRCDEARLVTITGAGGCGKTRLVLQLAAELVSGHHDGVWLVRLEALTDPALVAQAAAQAVGIPAAPSGSFEEALVDHLRARQTVLLFDNCEHLLEPVADLVHRLLANCSALAVLATSREPLGVPGEVVYRLRSLAVPDPAAGLAEAAASAAVRLFVERATAAGGFELQESNLPAVVAICRRLDGLPLALELAAARTSSLAVDRLAERLGQRFRLLTGGSRTALPRHRTLQAAVDWSYDLLEPLEQRALLNLSVFSGGWGLEQAEAVCADEVLDESEVAQTLGSLVDKSLVQYDDRADRYRMLETIRQYAAERVPAEQACAARERHLACFEQLAAEAWEHRSTEAATWLACLEAELQNLRAALDWSFAQPELTAGLRLAGLLYWFFDQRGYWREGLSYLTTALTDREAEPPSEDLVRALQGAGLLAMHLGETDAAEAYDLAALAACEELGDRVAYCRVAHNLGRLAQRRGDVATADKLVSASLNEQRHLDDPEGLAISLHSLGNLRSLQGDPAGAKVLVEGALAIMRELHDPGGIAYCLSSLGNVAQVQGDLATARALHTESLELQRGLGDRRGIGFALANLGVAARAQGDNETAAQCYSEGLQVSRDLGDRAAAAVFLVNLGSLSTEIGRAAEARRHLDDCRALCEETGNLRVLAFCHRNLGTLARAAGDWAGARSHYLASLALRRERGERSGYAELWECLAGLAPPELAARLAGAAQRLRDELGTPLTPQRQQELDELLRDARQHLGEATWARLTAASPAADDAVWGWLDAVADWPAAPAKGSADAPRG